MQTRLQSLKEVVSGTAVGGVGSWLITVAVLWLAEYFHVTNKSTIAAGTVTACTVWSLVRGYWWRRLHNQQLARRLNAGVD